MQHLLFYYSPNKIFIKIVPIPSVNIFHYLLNIFVLRNNIYTINYACQIKSYNRTVEANTD